MPLSFFDQENRWFLVQKQCFQFFCVYFGVSKFKWKMEMRGSDAKWQKFSFKGDMHIRAHVETLM